MDRKVDHKIIPAKKKLRKLSKDLSSGFFIKSLEMKTISKAKSRTNF